MGNLSLVCLLLVAGQGPGEVVPINHRNLQIPITVQPERRGEVQKMRLFVSSDDGKTWQQADERSPDESAFVFGADADGPYSFRVALVNRQGKQEPENVMQGPPDLRMLIDSRKPLVKIVSAQRQGDEISVKWEVQEEHPDWNSFKLDYRASDAGGIWTSTSAARGPRGETRFPAGGPGPVSVRLALNDTAGNSADVTAEVGAITPVGGRAPTAAPDKQTAPPSPPPPVSPFPGGQTAPPPPVSPPLPVPASPVAVPPDPSPLPPTVSSPPQSTPPAPPVTAPANFGTPPSPGGRVVASSENPNSGFTPPSAVSYVPGRKSLPSVQYVNNAEVTVEYELARVGPSGVASVELWWTKNDGQDWDKYAFDDQIKAPVTGGKYPRTLELPGDGLYGFALVVRSPAGRGRPAPRPGDVPEVRIEVDTIPPVAQLYAPQADPKSHDSLVLTWLAKDQNLAHNPVTLEWSPNREGPWHPIASNVPNSSRHVWNLPEQRPVEVFLRLKVRDTAGNEGVAVTPEPQNVDLSEPEGRIVNISVMPHGLPRRP